MIKSHVLYRLSYALTLSLGHDLFGEPVQLAIYARGRFFRIRLGPRCVGGGDLAVNSAKERN